MKRPLRISAYVAAGLILTAVSTPAQVISWIETTWDSPLIGRVNPDGSAYSFAPLTPFTSPEGLAWDNANGQLYFTELAWTGARVHSANQNFSTIAPVITGGSAFRGITVDGSGGRLYWASSNLVTGARIHRSFLDGSGEEILIDLSPGSNPRAIVIDTEQSMIYWTDFSLGAILRADALPGAAPLTVVSGLAGPVGLVIDTAQDVMYWVEANAGVIKRARLDGTDQTTIVSGLVQPQYLAIDFSGQRLYWTETQIPRIGTATLAGADVQTVPLSVHFPLGIAFIPAPEVPLTPVVSNGGFEFGIEPWVFYTNGAGSFSDDGIDDGNSQAGHVFVETPGTNVQLYQSGLTLEPNTPYRLRLQAYSNSGHDIDVLVHKHGAPYTNYGLEGGFDLGTSWNQYEVEFETVGFTAPVSDARLRFWFPPHAEAGDHYYFDDVVLEKITTVAPDQMDLSDSEPNEFRLFGNSPNPFNPTTQIRFSVEKSGPTRLAVYNILGARVALLFDAPAEPGRRYQVTFDASALGSGVYFSHLQSGNNSTIRRMMLVK